MGKLEISQVIHQKIIQVAKGKITASARLRSHFRRLLTDMKYHAISEGEKLVSYLAQLKPMHELSVLFEFLGGLVSKVKFYRFVVN